MNRILIDQGLFDDMIQHGLCVPASFRQIHPGDQSGIFIVTGKQLFFFSIIDTLENNRSSGDFRGNNIIHLSLVTKLVLIKHFKITIGSRIDKNDINVVIPEGTGSDHPFHLTLYTDLITFEYEIVSGNVEKDQTGKKDRKEFSYHQTTKISSLFAQMYKILISSGTNSVITFFKVISDWCYISSAGVQIFEPPLVSSIKLQVVGKKILDDFFACANIP
jgi:hypothetical protein